jgi:predicted RNA-binding Zn-ribbon protein involved in translation (DUF1610 family)
LVAAFFGGLALVAFPGTADAQRVLGKRCSNCNNDVPITSQVGQKCPYCGAYWGSEQSRYVTGGGSSSSQSSESHGPSFYMPMPRIPLERMAFYQALVQQRLIEQQLLREQARRLERQLYWQRMAELARIQRAAEAAKREEIRRRLR